MGYSEYRTMRRVREKLGLTELQTHIFPPITPIEPSDWLVQSLQLAYLMPLRNEKEKSERLVSPILIEVMRPYEYKYCLYSGAELSVDISKDLNGPCDFFVGLKPASTDIQAPIVSFVEAKDEDMEHGRAQCAAQMYAARIFNQQEGNPIEIIYGCACTGEMWQFLKLEGNTIYVEKQPLALIQIAAILGTFRFIIQSYS